MLKCGNKDYLRAVNLSLALVFINYIA